MSNYLQSFQKHASLFKALAHPRRLEIIHLIRDQELPVTDIHTMLDLPQANISQHLMVLRDANLVLTRREGKQVVYRLADQRIIQASDLMREYLLESDSTSTISLSSQPLDLKKLTPLVTDPICEMRLSPKTASYHLQHQDQDYYFCGSGCLASFKKQHGISQST